MNLRQQLKEIAQNLISGADFSPAIQLKAEPEHMEKLFVDKKPLPQKEKEVEEGFEKDAAEPMIDPVQKQSHSGPPAFGLPPSGKIGEPKLHEELEHALFYPGKYICLKKRIPDKFYDWKKGILNHCVKITEIVGQRIYGKYILGKNEITDFTENDVDWEKTNKLPDMYKVHAPIKEVHAKSNLWQIYNKNPLYGLEQEAKKYSVFKDFEHAYLGDIKHGIYWHITDNPKFSIDVTKSPRDMSSLAGGESGTPGLMITSHLEHWNEHYNTDSDSGKKKIARPYAALIDMSEVPKEGYKQVSRGFGNEFFISPKYLINAKVIKVMNISDAIRFDEKVHLLQPENSGELEKIFNKVHKSNIVELSAGGAGFVTTGPRNYGAPIGPGGGPGVMEKKYKFSSKKTQNGHVVEIFENNMSIYEVMALTKADASETAKDWLSSIKTSKE